MQLEGAETIASFGGLIRLVTQRRKVKGSVSFHLKNSFPINSSSFVSLHNYYLSIDKTREQLKNS